MQLLAAGKGSEGDCVFATAGYACGPGRGAVCIATGGCDVAARGGRARGSWYRSASLGRPTCMALPASLQFGAIVSLGCIGNRVYTGLDEDELYVVLRAKDLARVAEELHVISGANAALRDYPRGRRGQLSGHQQLDGE